MLSDEIDRFARICGMLGSDSSGERAAAAMKATEFLRAKKLTWDDFIRRCPAAAPRRKPHWSEGPRTDAEWLKALQSECWGYMTEWEQGFVDSILKRNRWPLSAKQREIVVRMKNTYAQAYE
jgi:hypothetical protein